MQTNRPELMPDEIEALAAMANTRMLTMEQHLILVALYPDCQRAYFETRVDRSIPWEMPMVREADLRLREYRPAGMSVDEFMQARKHRTDALGPYVERQMNLLRPSFVNGGPSREWLYHLLFR